MLNDARQESAAAAAAAASAPSGSGRGPRRSSTAGPFPHSNKSSRKRRSPDLDYEERPSAKVETSQRRRSSTALPFSATGTPPETPYETHRQHEVGPFVDPFHTASDSGGGSIAGESDYDPVDDLEGTGMGSGGMFPDDLALELPKGLSIEGGGHGVTETNNHAQNALPAGFAFDLASYAGSTATPSASADVAMHPEDDVFGFGFPSHGVDADLTGEPPRVSAAEVEALLGGSPFASPGGVVGTMPLSGGGGGSSKHVIGAASGGLKRSTSTGGVGTKLAHKAAVDGIGYAPFDYKAFAQKPFSYQNISLPKPQHIVPNSRTRSNSAAGTLNNYMDAFADSPFAPSPQGSGIRTLSGLPLSLQSLLGEHALQTDAEGQQFGFRNAMPSSASGAERPHVAFRNASPAFGGDGPDSLPISSHQNTPGADASRSGAKRRRMTEPSLAFAPFSIRNDSHVAHQHPLGLDSTLPIIAEPPSSPGTGAGFSNSRPSGASGLPSSHLDFDADLLAPMGLDDIGRMPSPLATGSGLAPAMASRDWRGLSNDQQDWTKQLGVSETKTEHLQSGNLPDPLDTSSEEFFEGARVNPTDGNLALMDRLVSPIKV
ncbi:hypothetical protein HDU93_003589, partial [Gonapodya sp. JEL0774]